MLTLRDIMTADPVTVGPEATLREVADLLTATGISGVPVVADSGEVLGVVSASDVLTFSATLPGVPVQRPDLSDWDDLPRADDEETPADYFADFWSDAGADVVARMSEVSSPEWDVLDEHSAGEIMTRRLQTIEVAIDLRTAAFRMVEAGVHRLLVVEKDSLIGVVTTMDFVKAIASGGLKL
jgi:predicted transcriptional regulator